MQETKNRRCGHGRHADSHTSTAINDHRDDNDDHVLTREKEEDHEIQQTDVKQIPKGYDKIIEQTVITNNKS